MASRRALERVFVAVLLAFSGIVALAQEAKQVTGQVLRDGTPIRIRINRTVSSADSNVGDNVDFEVLDDIKVGDLTVIPKGGLALGTVTQAQKKRRMGRGGKLDISIDHVRLVNGEKVSLRAVKESEGGGHVGKMTGAIVATSIVFFPAAPLFLFIKGKDITVPKGTEITTYVNGDYTVDPARFTAAAPIPSTQAPTTPADLAALVITSLPDGADITVDGKFAGTTPSTLRLSAGDHVVLIEKSGFKQWHRTVTVTTGSSINLSATLEE